MALSDPKADLYLWAYRRSTQKYLAVQQSMGEANILKLKHRSTIHDIIQKIILDRTPGPHIVDKIAHLIELAGLPKSDEKHSRIKSS